MSAPKRTRAVRTPRPYDPDAAVRGILRHIAHYISRIADLRGDIEHRLWLIEQYEDGLAKAKERLAAAHSRDSGALQDSDVVLQDEGARGLHG